ncbi:MAG TPA: Crp/Fnr family transcriptional regulator [Chloroflexota bacterium]
METSSTFDADVRSLHDTTIFGGLAPNELRELAKGARRCCYTRHQLISNLEEDDTSVWLLIRGSAGLYRLSSDGHEVTLALLVPGDILGLVYLESLSNPMSCVEATADETVMYCMPRPFFWRFIELHPGAVLGALNLLSHRLGHAYDRIEDLALCDTRTRLARVLARLAVEDESHVVSTTHDELARMIGTTRERVTKVLCYLRRSRVVAYQPHRRGIAVLDIDRLLAETSPHR